MGSHSSSSGSASSPSAIAEVSASMLPIGGHSATMPSGQLVTRAYIEACAAAATTIASAASMAAFRALQCHAGPLPRSTQPSALPPQTAPASSSLCKSYPHPAALLTGYATLWQACTADEFAAECATAVPRLYGALLARQQRRHVVNGIFYYAATSLQEVKVFRQHMRGLQALRSLAIPGLVIPQTAATTHLGVTFACIELLPLLTPIDPAETDSHHARAVLTLIAKALRLSGAVPLALFESGGGFLVCVDAAGLLPRASLPSNAHKAFHALRPELLLGGDLPESAAQLPASLLLLEGGDPRPVTPLSLLLCAASSCGPKARAAPVPALGMLFAASTGASTAVGATACFQGHDDFVLAAGGASALSLDLLSDAPTFPLKVPRPQDPHTAASIFLQTHVQLLALEAADALPEDADQAQFVRALHRRGYAVHLLGQLWRTAQGRHGENGKRLRLRIATELLARALRHVLNTQLSATAFHPNANARRSGFEVEVIAAVARGAADRDYTAKYVHPQLTEHYALADTFPVVGKDTTLHAVLARFQQLTGTTFANGRYVSSAAVVRVVRGLHPFTAAEVADVCTAASKREAVAGAAIISACAWHTRNVGQLFKLVDQLRARLPFPSGPVSPSAIATQAFVALLELTLFCLIRFSTVHANGSVTVRPTSAAAAANGNGVPAQPDGASREQLVALLLRALPDQRVNQLMNIFKGSPHDSLFISRYILSLAERLLQVPSAVTNGAVLVRLILDANLFRGGSEDTHPVARRFLFRDLHRASIDACYATKQLAEAPVIAKRWAKLCPGAFGKGTPEHFEACRLLMIAHIKHRNRREAVRAALAQLQCAELVFAAAKGRGPPDALKIAAACNDVGSLTWRRTPHFGIIYFKRAMELYRAHGGGPSTRALCTTYYNVAVALIRLGRFVAAVKNATAALQIAAQHNEASVAKLCRSSLSSLYTIAAVRIQRWYRETHYGVARSQTTHTDVTMTHSVLSWSDDQSDIASTADLD